MAWLRDQIVLPLMAKESIVDLNYLYQRYFVSLQMSKSAACDGSRIAHRKLADGYAVQIADAKIHGTGGDAR